MLILGGWLRCQATVVWFQPSYLRALPRAVAGGRIRVMITQAPLGAGVLSEYDTGRGVVIGEILSLQTILDDGPKEVSGRVVLEADSLQEHQALRGLAEGTEIKGEGVFLMPPEFDDMVNGFYGEYLQAQGICHILRLREWHPVGYRDVWDVRCHRCLRHCREALGLRLVQGIRKTDNAQLLLALGLGMGEFIPKEIRERQVSSGTVHVFAISGMHVGMAALVISLLLRWSGLPLRWQWMLTGVLDGIYVLLTGASASGVRALVMALLVLYARFRWRPPSWLNTLGLAGSAGVLWNPMNVLNLGFVYSYAVVAILLLTGPICREISTVIGEKDAWIPREMRHRHRTALCIWLVNGMLVSFVAWLGGIGISMRINHRLSLVAPLVNLPLGVMVYLTLMLCPLRILLGAFCPWLDSVYAWVLEHAISMTNALAVCGGESQSCLPMAQITYWQSVLFYLALSWVLLSEEPRKDDKLQSSEEVS